MGTIIVGLIFGFLATIAFVEPRRLGDDVLNISQNPGENWQKIVQWHEHCLGRGENIPDVTGLTPICKHGINFNVSGIAVNSSIEHFDIEATSSEIYITGKIVGSPQHLVPHYKHSDCYLIISLTTSTEEIVMHTIVHLSPLTNFAFYKKVTETDFLIAILRSVPKSKPATEVVAPCLRYEFE